MTVSLYDGLRHLPDPERMEAMTRDPTGDQITSVMWKADVLRLEIDTAGAFWS
jgi:hypothetical protein